MAILRRLPNDNTTRDLLSKCGVRNDDKLAEKNHNVANVMKPLLCRLFTERTGLSSKAARRLVDAVWVTNPNDKTQFHHRFRGFGTLLSLCLLCGLDFTPREIVEVLYESFQGMGRADHAVAVWATLHSFMQEQSQRRSEQPCSQGLPLRTPVALMKQQQARSNVEPKANFDTSNTEFNKAGVFREHTVKHHNLGLDCDSEKNCAERHRISRKRKRDTSDRGQVNYDNDVRGSPTQRQFSESPIQLERSHEDIDQIENSWPLPVQKRIRINEDVKPTAQSTFQSMMLGNVSNWRGLLDENDSDHNSDFEDCATPPTITRTNSAMFFANSFSEMEKLQLQTLNYDNDRCPMSGLPLGVMDILAELE